MAGDGKDPILDFMVVRAPGEVASADARRRYIFDRTRVTPPQGPGTHIPDDPPDPQALERVSPIGRIVYDLVFHSNYGPGTEGLDALRDKLLATLRPYRAARLPGEPAEGGAGTVTTPALKPLTLRVDDLARHAHIVIKDLYYILPDRLQQLAEARLPLIAELLQARPILEAATRPSPTSTSFDVSALQAQLQKVFGGPIWQILLSVKGHSDAYINAHRALFDCLYLLYLLRRWATVDLSDLINGLQLLHTLDALAIDGLYTAARSGKITTDDLALLDANARIMPEFRGWDGKSAIRGLPYVDSTSSLAELLDAHPVVNPLLTRLFWFRQPFNNVKPIGIGDLKVVKQWLTAYRPGEISHIHNIMKGESRSRDHTRTERSEEVFSLATTRSEEATRDTQSTERFEVKAEAENVVRASLNVTANANLTYNNSAAMITASAGAGFGYNRATEDHTRTAQNFARDVVTKAVERVQSQTSSQRTITQTFETVEKNGQSFSNVNGKKHVSGIYRWVDKEYTAQIFNYGKRLMFEFVIPQPAAFWVKSRLQAYENSLEVPQPPFPIPSKRSPNLPFAKDEITEGLFASLKVHYDLREIPAFPAQFKLVTIREAQSRGRQFAEKDISGHDYSRTFDASLVGAAGYRATEIDASGYAEFHHRNADNRMSLVVNGRMAWEDTRDAYQWPLKWRVSPQEEIEFTSDETTLTLFVNNELKFYDAAFVVRLERLPSTLENWRQLVWDTIVQIERKKLASEFEEEQLDYQARLSEYRSRLARIQADTIKEILAGRSDAANKLVIDEEIKKHCLTMLTKEFDTTRSDDILSTKTTVGTRTVTTRAYGLTVTEAKTDKEKTRVGHDLRPRNVDYPAIDIDVTREKGSVVQFLEQAFEWERLSYVFYPYFWGEEKDWIELMNREDDADATFTAFLRSGMARVLVAATPAYEDAVLYYLDTREPWAGGPSPVIGDSLFVALHDEMRAQTDDRSAGIPEGDPWTFTVPTSLVYLHGSDDALPDIQAERAKRATAPG